MAPTDPSSTTITPLLLTEQDVAAMLQVTPGVVLTLHRKGRLRGVNVGHNLRWKPASVRAFIDTLQPEGQE